MVNRTGKCLTLKPPTGKIYIFAKELLKDWNKGVSFEQAQNVTAPLYISIYEALQLRDDGYTHVQFVNSRGTELTTVDL